MFEHHNKNQKRTVFKIFLPIFCISFIIFIWLLAYYLNGGHLHQEASLQNFAICSAANVENVIERNQLERGAETIVVCGTLQSDSRRKITLGFIIRRGVDNQLMNYDSSIETFPGSFSYEIVLEEPLEEGDYRLYTYFGRQELATLDFEVVP